MFLTMSNVWVAAGGLLCHGSWTLDAVYPALTHALARTWSFGVVVVGPPLSDRVAVSPRRYHIDDLGPRCAVVARRCAVDVRAGPHLLDAQGSRLRHHDR